MMRELSYPGLSYDRIQELKPTVNEPELLRPRGVQPLILELFPKASRPIARMIHDCLDILDTMCALNNEGEPRILWRGSAITRLSTSTPENYWMYPSVFQSIIGSELIGDVQHETTHTIVQHLADGPDMDIMYILDRQFTDADVYSRLEELLERRKNELALYDIRVHVNSVPLNIWNGEADTRQYTQITFETLDSTSNIWKYAFRIDIGKEPVEEESGLDGRLSGYMTTMDFLSVGELKKHKNGVWYVHCHADSVDYLRRYPNALLYRNIPPRLLPTIASRYIVQQILWPKDEDLIHYMWRQAQPVWIPQTSWNVPSFPRDEYFLFEPEKILLYQPRESDMLTNFLLGATADPFQWLEYARISGVLQNTKLGQFWNDIPTRQLLLASYTDGMFGCDHLRRLINDFPLSVIQELSDQYISQFWSLVKYPKFIGPLRIVRALLSNKLLLPETPVTIQTFLELVKPADFSNHGS